MAEETKMTYTIADQFLEDLRKKVNRIAKKCASLGQPISFEVGEPTAIETRLENGLNVLYPAHYVTVEGIAKIEGWTFIAKIEHTDAGNLIMCAPNMECPSAYRDAEPICEHCGTRHHRKETFVIRSDKGEYRQIGRNCLALYTNGLDAEACAQYAEIAYLLERDGGRAPSGEGWGYDPEVFVAACLANIEKDGYDRDNMDLRVEHSIRWQEGESRPSAMRYLEEREDKVRAVIETARAMTPVSDYERNVQVVLSMEAIPMKYVRIVASYCAKYLRDQMKAQATAKKAAESSHVGEVGERIRFKVKATDGKAYRILFTKSVYIAWNTYSTTYVVELIDTDGNVYKWNASNLGALDQAITEGATELQIVGTVKEHSEYKGVKQTVITRCRLA